ncbi:hypothetical protein AND4_00653 [Vibrio sp. AND4]|nr:MepB family protein [Vibrio sp. AND4]EDP59873.1 hypothetical protein AND4_00653 [Vibrio sp. AND4]
MSECKYLHQVSLFIRHNFTSKGCELTSPIALDRYPQNSKYQALEFSIDGKKVLYRKGNVTPDRPGNFLSIWKRPEENSIHPGKTMPYEEHYLDYLFVEVGDYETSKRGIYIFPLAVLINKGIVTSNKTKGKMALRVFPPWTSSRGELKSKVFSDSAKKTQKWQSRFFLWIEDNEIVDLDKCNNIFSDLN